jgi:hypothetical protein
LIQCVRRTHPGWITLRGVSTVSAARSAVSMVLMVSYRDVFLSQIRFFASAFLTNPVAKIALACAAI